MEHYQSRWTAKDQSTAPLPPFPWAGHHFEECHFEGLDLNHSDWRDARFERCTFQSCSLSEVRLTNVRFHGVTFTDCTLNKVRWTTLQPSFMSFSLERCKAPLCDWEDMDLRGMKFEHTDLSGNNFSGADARETSWTESRLRDAIFQRTDLRDADFRSATEWTIDPSDNRLRGARFDANDLIGLVKALGIRID
jgi:uncharacterized protein YjbI with pentapeptide repeats